MPELAVGRQHPWPVVLFFFSSRRRHTRSLCDWSSECSSDLNEQQLLGRYYTITGWAEALQRKGIDVSVVNRFHKESFLEVNKVKYHFVKDNFRGGLKS